jgi:hypothetical protein
MLSQETQEVKRKITAILKILSDSDEPIGRRTIARQLENYGISLTERAVGYHLTLLDERGLTKLVNNKREGRLITPLGLEEFKNTKVSDKVRLAISTINHLTYHTSFKPETRSGNIPVNVSVLPLERIKEALAAMEPVFKAGICVTDLVAVACSDERLARKTIPEGKVGFATVSTVAVCGILTKAGISVEPKFGGLLQIRNQKPQRFVELIEYAGSSVDPSEVFIAHKMTDVSGAVGNAQGKVLASFQEIPALSKSMVEKTLAELRDSGFQGTIIIGEPNEPLCEVPVGLNKVGMIVLDGLNPVAAAAESGVECENYAMSEMIDFQKLESFWGL